MLGAINELGKEDESMKDAALKAAMPELEEEEGGVECIDAGHTNLLLTWEPIDGCVKYQLEWRKKRSPGADQEDDWMPLGKNGFSSPNPPKNKSKLTSGTSFEFRVRGRDQVDWFGWSSPRTHTTMAAGGLQLPPITRQDAQRADVASDGGITVQWDAAEGATAYELQIRETSAVRWTTVSRKIKGTMVRKKNLSPDGLYLFRVMPLFESETTTSQRQEVWYMSPPSAPFKVAQCHPFLQNLLGPRLVDAKGVQYDVSSRLAGAVVGLYFSASWCPPCRQYTPMLAQLYLQARAAGRRFEVVFISGDKEAASMQGYHEKMPWLAIPFEDSRRQTIQAQFAVNGIPNLKIFGPQGNLLDDNAVQSGRLTLPNLSVWESGGSAGQAQAPPHAHSTNGGGSSCSGHGCC